MTQSQGLALGWYVPRRWRSRPAAVKTSITWPGESANEEVRSPKFRQFDILSSSFGISPILGEFDQFFDDLHRRDGVPSPEGA
jgi:hypothetical protein